MDDAFHQTDPDGNRSPDLPIVRKSGALPVIASYMRVWSLVYGNLCPQGAVFLSVLGVSLLSRGSVIRVSPALVI